MRSWAGLRGIILALIRLARLLYLAFLIRLCSGIYLASIAFSFHYIV